MYLLLQIEGFFKKNVIKYKKYFKKQLFYFYIGHDAI